MGRWIRFRGRYLVSFFTSAAFGCGAEPPTPAIEQLPAPAYVEGDFYSITDQGAVRPAAASSIWFVPDSVDAPAIWDRECARLTDELNQWSEEIDRRNVAYKREFDATPFPASVDVLNEWQTYQSSVRERARHLSRTVALDRFDSIAVYATKVTRTGMGAHFSANVTEGGYWILGRMSADSEVRAWILNREFAAGDSVGLDLDHTTALQGRSLGCDVNPFRPDSLLTSR